MRARDHVPFYAALARNAVSHGKFPGARLSPAAWDTGRHVPAGAAWIPVEYEHDRTKDGNLTHTQASGTSIDRRAPLAHDDIDRSVRADQHRTHGAGGRRADENASPTSDHGAASTTRPSVAMPGDLWRKLATCARPAPPAGAARPARARAGRRPRLGASCHVGTCRRRAAACVPWCAPGRWPRCFSPA